MKLFKTFKNLLLIGLTLTLIFSCKKKSVDPDVQNEPVLPVEPGIATYSGNKQDMIMAQMRLAMMDSLIEYAKEGNSKGVFVDSTVLKNMFYNTSNPFSSADLDNSGINIAEAVDPIYKQEIESHFGKLSVASKSQTYGSDGVAGVVLGNNATTGKLYDENGLARYELIEKGFMGSLQLYQITQKLLTEQKLNYVLVKEQKLKIWDSAFAYLGVTPDFINYKITKPGLSFWAEYFGTNDAKLGGNVALIMNAFINGRAAIEKNDNKAVIDNAKVIRSELDRTAAGMALTYLRKTRLNIINNDNGRRNGAFSEALGFLNGLRSHPEKKIAANDLTILINDLGTSSWSYSSLSDTTKIINAYTKLANSYSLDAKTF